MSVDIITYWDTSWLLRNLSLCTETVGNSPQIYQMVGGPSGGRPKWWERARKCSHFDYKSQLSQQEKAVPSSGGERTGIPRVNPHWACSGPALPLKQVQRTSECRKTLTRCSLTSKSAQSCGGGESQRRGGLEKEVVEELKGLRGKPFKAGTLVRRPTVRGPT